MSSQVLGNNCINDNDILIFSFWFQPNYKTTMRTLYSYFYEGYIELFIEQDLLNKKAP